MFPSSWFKDFMAAAGVDLSAGKPPHKAPLGPPMTLANMRKNGVRSLSAQCLNPRCYHEAEFDANRYPEHLPVKSFEPRMVCSCCGGRWVDVRPAWSKRGPFDCKG